MLGSMKYKLILIICCLEVVALQTYALGEDENQLQESHLSADTTTSNEVLNEEIEDESKEPRETNDEIESHFMNSKPDSDTTPDEWSAENKYSNPSQIFWGMYYANVYDRINNVLVEKVPGDYSPEANIDYATTWLKTVDRKKIFSFFVQYLIKALEQLTALATITPENLCTRDTFAILFKNSKAVREKVHVPPSKLGPLRRIESVIHHYLLKHAVDCIPQYPDIFRKFYQQGNYTAVEIFQDAIIEARRKSSTEWIGLKKKYSPTEEAYHIALETKSFKAEYKARIAIETIRLLATDDQNVRYLEKLLDEKNGRIVVAPGKIKGLIERYLVEPCEELVRKLGTNVFTPLNFDLAVMEPNDLLELDVLSDGEYQMGLARFKLCKVLIQERNSLAKSVVSLINKT